MILAGGRGTKKSLPRLLSAEQSAGNRESREDQGRKRRGEKKRKNKNKGFKGAGENGGDEGGRRAVM